MSDIRQAISNLYALAMAAVIVWVILTGVFMLKASRDFDKMLDQGDANPQAQVEELEKLRQEDVGPPSNPERFSKLVDEMSYSEVVEILGKPGVKVSEDTLNEGKIRLEMYFWEGDDGAFAIATCLELVHASALNL